MKIKDLIQEIENCKKQYGDEFLEWNVYTEQLTEFDKSVKRGERTVKCINGELNQSDWGNFKDSEDWEYFECAGFWTKIPDKKIFTINVNY